MTIKKIRRQNHGHLQLFMTNLGWGAPAKLISENANIQSKVKEALEAGVHITACKACADQLGVSEDLGKLGIEIIYWGVPLTDILKTIEFGIKVDPRHIKWLQKE